MNKGLKFLSDLKLYSDYFKWKDFSGLTTSGEKVERYENWNDACADILSGHFLHYKDYADEIRPYLQSASESMGERLVLASQRNLQYRGPEIKKHNARMYNCVSMHLCRNRAFQEIFYLGLCGCGVGVGLLRPFVDNLSRIDKRKGETKTFVIPDSIEGWADALGILLSSYFVDKQPFPEYAGCKVRFDYSEIREQGAFISGGFKAPGPEGLKQSLEKIEALLENWIETEGNVIRPILGMDIICHASDAVLSGGVRRSALDMILDPNDEESIMAKIGDWRTKNPQRGRTNNSVLMIRGEVTKEYFEYIVGLNEGDSDIGFVFANSWFDMFNPCFEISKIPCLVDTDYSKIIYNEIAPFVKKYEDQFGVQGCNLTEINAQECTTEEKFLKACKDASILGTFQAGYTNFPYLGRVSEGIFKRESLLGVSVTGWMNNPKLFNADLLRRGAEVVKNTNKELAAIIKINPAARTTCVKPSGNASVILGTASGIHPEHSERYFRVMQLNKNSTTAKYLEENMSFLLEDSVWSATSSDWVVFVPIVHPKNGLFKKDLKGVKHLELIKLVQENWVIPGTNEDLCAYKGINHNVSCTVIIDNKREVVDYIWDNKESFTAVSFLSDYGDKDFNQAPFTSVLSLEEIVQEYGNGALLASGLIVDALHVFDENLWEACDWILNTDKNKKMDGTRHRVLLKEDWLKRAKKFAKNYFKGDLKKLVYCLKDVHLFHKWQTINRQFKEVDFNKILKKVEYKQVSEYASMACSGDQCQITRI